MKLGAFSISLAVKNLSASREFYEHLGFAMIAGDGESWVILANEGTAIGLFHGAIHSNMLTFNPGWTGLGDAAEDFEDVRGIKAALAEAGIEAKDDTTQESLSGPASFQIKDPDGNVILFDQHV